MAVLTKISDHLCLFTLQPILYSMRLFFIFIVMLAVQTKASAQETEKMFLSGTGNDNTVEWEFYCTDGRNSGEWTTIPVPSCWELQGFGTYSYGRPYEGQPEEKGMYKYTFQVPETWKKKKVDIVFDGSMTDTEVKINGKSAGPIHQGAFYQFKYDISKLLKYGSQNLLEVTVAKNSANQSVNEAERYADFWIFGGIFRPVWLEARPSESIENFAIDAKADGTFMVRLHLDNIRKSNQVSGQITTLAGEPVSDRFITEINRNQDTVILTTQINSPNLWSPEFPNLYLVSFDLEVDGEVVHQEESRFGFRTVELKPGDGIYVNGTKILMKGVNRHSAWPTSGRTLNKSLSIQDVKLMKEMNMNAVRMSHYPPDGHFLDVCDSLGLFVLDELTGWQQAYDTEVGSKLVKELVVRDVNHPSIIIWDNGNEGGHNRELVDDYWIYDPQKRPVIHPWEIFRDTDTQHYKSYNCCTGTLFNGREIFFPTEFLHGLFDGGHGAGLEDYWKLIKENPLGAGGFLWVFADEGIVRTDQNNKIDVQGSQAPDGIVGPYREKEGSFFTIKELWSPVQVDLKYLDKNFNGEIRLQNEFLYTNLNQCEFNWQLADFPAPGDSKTGKLVKDKGKPNSPTVAPGESGNLKLYLPANWDQYDALYLSAKDPHGEEIYTWSWMIKSPSEIAQGLLTESDGAATGQEEENGIVLSANGKEITIDASTGQIAEVKSDGKLTSFNNGPVLAAGASSFNNISHSQEGNDYLVKVDLDGEMKEIEYRMKGNGWLEVSYRYLLNKGKYDFMGVNFDYPEEKVNGMTWLGKGPYRVWKNRMKGVEYNVWQKDYNNTVTGEKLWQYPEFKGYHANFYWARLDTDEVPITILTAENDQFLRIFQPDPPEAAYNDNTEPKFPEGDISVLRGISAIGTKFKKPEELGPMSEQNIHETNRKNLPELMQTTLYFYFGE